MDSAPELTMSVSEFVDILNQTYDYAFPSVTITGELANLRVSKNKWVYFDLKDEDASVKFFGTVYHLPGPLEDGMLMQVRGAPHMHNLYGFSVNVQAMQPAGEGSIRRAADLLAAKLKAEGLFDDSRKRPLPYPPTRIGLITSAQSAAYADFIKILGARWGGVEIELIDVQVQGDVAPSQIVSAVERFNELAKPPQVLVIIRGGGSTDDLAAFSAESVTRAVGASRVSTLVAIGHEIDVSLAELAADRRASTPSNAAEMLVPDRRVVLEALAQTSETLYDHLQDYFYAARQKHEQFTVSAAQIVERLFRDRQQNLEQYRQLLEVLSPQAALRRGYAVVRHGGQVVRAAEAVKPGDIVQVELARSHFEAKVVDSDV